MRLTKQLLLFVLSLEVFMCKGQPGIPNRHQIDHCKIRNPCRNEGQCSVNMYGLIDCSCAEGFTGDVCQISCNDIVESCPDGFEMLPPGSGKCYHISPLTTTLNFLQAQRYCRDLFVMTSLWEPKSQNDLDNLSFNLNENGTYWTGIFDVLDEGSLIYVGTGKSVPSTLINDAHPDDMNCVYYETGSGLKHGKCGFSRRIVCEKLNPCDIPDDPVLPVPLLQQSWEVFG